jgi:hypothetical protein
VGFRIIPLLLKRAESTDGRDLLKTEFPDYLRNIIIETAREVITGPLGFGTQQFERALRAMRQWGRRSDATIGYGLCWTEGERN